MKKGGGKAKGAQFERDICKQLSLWLSDNKQEDLFWRSAMSGGRATLGLNKGVKHSAQAGDISAIQSLGHKFIERFYIECKFYKNLEVDDIVFCRGTGTLRRFIEVALEDADHHGKCTLLIAKQNFRPTLAILDHHAYKELGMDLLSSLPLPTTTYIKGRLIHIGQLDQLLSIVDPRTIDLLI